MKYAAMVAALLCLFAVSVSSQPNKTTATREQSPEPNSPPRLPPPSNNITTYYAEHPKDDPPKWYAPVERPDWWLVFIAGLTGWAVFYEGREMKDGTEVMRGEIKAMNEQLGQMKTSGEQTDRLIEHTVIQTNTAILTANAAINSKRARIAIRFTSFSGGRTDDGRPINQFEVFALNEGGSTAEITSTFCERITILPGDELPHEPIYDPAKILHRREWGMKKKEIQVVYCKLAKVEGENFEKIGGNADFCG